MASFQRCVSLDQSISTKFGTSVTSDAINYITKFRSDPIPNDRFRVDYSYRLNFSIFFSDVPTLRVIFAANIGRRRTILAPVERPVHCGQ